MPKRERPETTAQANKKSCSAIVKKEQIDSAFLELFKITQKTPTADLTEVHLAIIKNYFSTENAVMKFIDPSLSDKYQLTMLQLIPSAIAPNNHHHTLFGKIIGKIIDTIYSQHSTLFKQRKPATNAKRKRSSQSELEKPEGVINFLIHIILYHGNTEQLRWLAQFINDRWQINIWELSLQNRSPKALANITQYIPKNTSIPTLDCFIRFMVREKGQAGNFSALLNYIINDNIGFLFKEVLPFHSTNHNDTPTLLLTELFSRENSTTTLVTLVYQKLTQQPNDSKLTANLGYLITALQSNLEALENLVVHIEQSTTKEQQFARLSKHVNTLPTKEKLKLVMIYASMPYPFMRQTVEAFCRTVQLEETSSSSSSHSTELSNAENLLASLKIHLESQLYALAKAISDTPIAATTDHTTNNTIPSNLIPCLNIITVSIALLTTIYPAYAEDTLFARNCLNTLCEVIVQPIWQIEDIQLTKIKSFLQHLVDQLFDLDKIQDITPIAEYEKFLLSFHKSEISIDDRRQIRAVATSEYCKIIFSYFNCNFMTEDKLQSIIQHFVSSHLPTLYRNNHQLLAIYDCICFIDIANKLDEPAKTKAVTCFYRAWHNQLACYDTLSSHDYFLQTLIFIDIYNNYFDFQTHQLATTGFIDFFDNIFTLNEHIHLGFFHVYEKMMRGIFENNRLTKDALSAFYYPVLISLLSKFSFPSPLQPEYQKEAANIFASLMLQIRDNLSDKHDLTKIVTIFKAFYQINPKNIITLSSGYPVSLLGCYLLIKDHVDTTPSFSQAYKTLLARFHELLCEDGFITAEAMAHAEKELQRVKIIAKHGIQAAHDSQNVHRKDHNLSVYNTVINLIETYVPENFAHNTVEDTTIIELPPEMITTIKTRIQQHTASIRRQCLNEYCIDSGFEPDGDMTAVIEATYLKAIKASTLKPNNFFQNTQHDPQQLMAYMGLATTTPCASSYIGRLDRYFHRYLYTNANNRQFFPIAYKGKDYKIAYDSLIILVWHAILDNTRYSNKHTTVQILLDRFFQEIGSLEEPAAAGTYCSARFLGCTLGALYQRHQLSELVLMDNANLIEQFRKVVNLYYSANPLEFNALLLKLAQIAEADPDAAETLYSITIPTEIILYWKELLMSDQEFSTWLALIDRSKMEFECPNQKTFDIFLESFKEILNLNILFSCTDLSLTEEQVTAQNPENGFDISNEKPACFWKMFHNLQEKAQQAAKENAASSNAAQTIASSSSSSSSAFFSGSGKSIKAQNDPSCGSHMPKPAPP